VAADAYQLAVFLGAEVRTFDLPSDGEVTIGRGEGSTVRVDDPSVSRRHAVLHLGSKLVIEDVSGGNGILVCDKVGAGAVGQTVGMRQVFLGRSDLAVGERILIGTTSLVVRRAPAADTPEMEIEGGVVRDPLMQALYQQASRAARSPISVLILGETGVGKEVLARVIHARSPRAAGPFMGINCAALPDSLLESELFGSEKGAFTGAVAPRAGLFEAAQGGTVFLDEIGELPLATQGKLLRVIEERAVTRLGSTRARRIEVRFLAATNRDVEADSKQGRFRQDLYFRLAGITLAIPPLRERPAEIEHLVERFVAAACRQVERAAPLDVSPEAWDLLRRYEWPGNVRELRNAVERAVVLCAGDAILPKDLPPSLRAPARASASDRGAGPLAGELKALERARISEALERCDGNQSRAAELLGMPRRTLISRLAEFGLARPRKRTLD
jgi:DNA-binding NtrC family response regulator